jgi:predicted TIM-barrel fold metal-dependent hydrolase
VIDADLHVIEPPTLWKDRLAEPFRWQTKIGFRPGGHLEVSGYQFDLGDVHFTTSSDMVIRQSQRRWERDPHLAAAHLDARPAVYLEGMDAEGIDVAYLVPTLSFLILTCDGLDPAHAAAICRAYNDWVHDFASEAPNRLQFWGWLPRQAPELAAEEARRCLEDLGAAGVAMTSGAVDGHLLSDPGFDPLWRELDHLDAALGIHLYGTAPGMRDDVQARFHNQPASELPTATMNGIYQAQSSIPELIGAGVPERFPNMRFVIMEVASAWLLWLVQKMDDMWEMYGPDTRIDLSLRPSDYLRRQFFVTAEPDEKGLPYLIEESLADSLVFSTDYPHHDSPWPEGTRTFLRQPIPEEAKRKILSENAERLFHRAVLVS